MARVTIEQDLAGKVVVVTGANSGIGLVASKNFAARGASLAIVCRSEERGHWALDLLKRESGNIAIELFLADLSSLAATKALAGELKARHSAIHILVNNAGGANAGHQLTTEGFELTFVSNHLSNFLLTETLLPCIERAASESLARIVFTSSLGHKNSPLDFADLNLEHGYSTLKAYGRSKLMNLLTAQTLHRRLGASNVAVSSFHPGAVRTAIWSKGGAVPRILGFVMYPFMRSEEKGAETLIWLATSQDEEALSPGGNYFFDKAPAKTAPFANEEAGERLYQESLKLIQPWL
ncbi:MAG: NAD(P)-dependent dehydrogenase (short-subunit alcohol dehydrogenase family) [Pseudohongiellaceae bacterium]|jgi:NAD(P)-dependent dehydrogenase (short-subunit alcohol dehydrogenase family)